MSTTFIGGRSARETISEPVVQKPAPKKTFSGVDAFELAKHEFEQTDWLVEYVFSADQPTIFGAASKATKTTQLVDLSVALATGTQWLGNFEIPRVRKVLFITGESSKRAIAKRIIRSLKVRGLGWGDVQGMLRVEAVEFPTLPSAEDQVAIQSDVADHNIEVVIVDPLYRGLGGLDTNRMAEMGSAIVEFSKCCQPASLILSHHSTKSSARELGPPTLESLSGAGVAESCGNWWLIGRNEPYQFDRKHDLAVTYGGREEQSGFKRIQFDEAAWTFEISSGQDIKEDQQRERDEKRQAVKEKQLNEVKAAVKHCLANQPQAVSKDWIERRVGRVRTTVRQAVGELLTDGTLSEAEYRDGKNRVQIGIILTPKNDARGCSRMLADNQNGEHVEMMEMLAANPPLGGGGGGEHQLSSENVQKMDARQDENTASISRGQS